LKCATGSIWVRWYHGNSTFPPYWNAKMPSFAQYELIKPRERPAIWWISSFPWYHITQRGCCEFQYCGNTHFFSAFNIVWMNPYHRTRQRQPVLCILWNNPLIILKFYSRVIICLKESFRLIYSNTHLRIRETLPLKRDLSIDVM
jgi:hypothetical protein